MQQYFMKKTFALTTQFYIERQPWWLFGLSYNRYLGNRGRPQSARAAISAYHAKHHKGQGLVIGWLT